MLVPAIGAALLFARPCFANVPADSGAAPLAAGTRAAPPPSTGFQGAFRMGMMFPMADATGDDSLGDLYAWQLPVAVDLGAKVTPRLFVGGYFGLGFGATGSDSRLEAACDDDDEDLENDITCTAITIRAGLEAHWAFRPGERLNPWVGYGFGYEAATATINDYERGYKESVTMSGFTYAELTGGLDFRAGPVGAGPLLTAAIGQFTHSSTDSDGQRVFGGAVDDRALHAWITLGLRAVLNP